MSTDLKEALQQPRLSTADERAAVSRRLAEAATTTPLSPEDWVLTEDEKLQIAAGKASPELHDKSQRNTLLCDVLAMVGSVPDSEL